uniref:Amine oxidase n=1 Tax=uncultured Thiotrichaceae bacterium TaxID=298394 RepID=A0A6S6U5F3_9GAMM|nr:MAG: Monoamine oxidase [uncultured Thiotrichaceae bacterium]
MKLTLTFITSILLLAWHQSLIAAPDNTCQGNNIRKNFPSGASWDICWTIATKEGLKLSQVHFKTPNSNYRRVLGEASLSQIQAGFDDGATDPVYITTQMGLGGNNAQTIDQQTCNGGELHAENGRNVLCARTMNKGYLYKYNSQRQTEAFELSSYSQIGPRNYQLRWTFYENGTIQPAIGLSGVLPAVDESAEQYGWPVGQNGEIATGFTDHYLWRLDFDLDDSHGNDSVQEISSVPSADRLKKFKTINTLQTETAKKLNPGNKTFWRIVDSNTPHPDIGPVSYEIVPAHYDQSGANSLNQSWLSSDMYFTRYNRCERHMANNPTAGCSSSVTEFINNNQSIEQADVVAWYKQSNHYLPRSEDSNRIATRWSSFQLFPRDWNTKNPY